MERKESFFPHRPKLLRTTLTVPPGTNWPGHVEGRTTAQTDGGGGGEKERRLKRPARTSRPGEDLRSFKTRRDGGIGGLERSGGTPREKEQKAGADTTRTFWTVLSEFAVCGKQFVCPPV